jgi:hypothetical protein
MKPLSNAVRTLLPLALLCLLIPLQPAQAQVHKLGELNTGQIRALDRARTVVILTGGMMEEHGPYLPAYTDGYLSERMTQGLARAISARPGWNVVIFSGLGQGRRATSGQPAPRVRVFCA